VIKSCPPRVRILIAAIGLVIAVTVCASLCMSKEANAPAPESPATDTEKPSEEPAEAEDSEPAKAE